MFSAILFTKLLLNIFLFTCVCYWGYEKTKNIKHVILINSQVKQLLCFLQLYVQTVHSFKINVLVRSAKLLYREYIKNEVLYPNVNFLSHLRDTFWKSWKILNLHTKWLDVVQMNFFPCIPFSDIIGIAITTENNFMISSFLLHPCFLGWNFYFWLLIPLLQCCFSVMTEMMQ